MKLFKWLIVWECGTEYFGQIAYGGLFTDKHGHGPMENWDVYTAEEIGQMMGGN